jgi:hypothetical protein
MDNTTIEALIGKTLTSISVNEDEIIFTCDNGEKYLMTHYQNCCESVTVEDIVGDINDLLNSPILIAREDTSNDNPEGFTKEYQDSFTWTFYNIATARGHVTIRWYGESNGYYSESVDFKQIS